MIKGDVSMKLVDKIMTNVSGWLLCGAIGATALAVIVWAIKWILTMLGVVA